MDLVTCHYRGTGFCCTKYHVIQLCLWSVSTTMSTNRRWRSKCTACGEFLWVSELLLCPSLTWKATWDRFEWCGKWNATVVVDTLVSFFSSYLTRPFFIRLLVWYCLFATNIHFVSCQNMRTSIGRAEFSSHKPKCMQLTANQMFYPPSPQPPPVHRPTRKQRTLLR